MRFETRYLQNFLEKLDEQVDQRKISDVEYIQICLLLKIYEALQKNQKEDPLK